MSLKKLLFGIFTISLVMIIIIGSKPTYNSPIEAALDHYQLQSYLDKGYKLNDTETHPITWKKQPKVAYDWGYVTIDLMDHIKVEGEEKTHFVTLTCKISHAPAARSTGKYQVSKVNSVVFTSKF